MIWRILKNLLRWRQAEQFIADDEVCRRFIFSKSDRNASVVKPGAFAPSPNTFNTSIFLKSRFESDEAFASLRNKIVKERDQSLKGEAEFSAGVVEEVRQELEGNFTCSLRLVLDESKHKHHANIDNWPEPKEQKLLVQTALASRATLL